MTALADTSPEPLTVLQQPLPLVGRRRRAWTAGIAAAVLAIYLAGLTPHWYLGKDTGLYMNLGRNLARGDGYTIAGRPHTCVPPGLPWLIAAEMALFGEGFLALNATMCLMALAVVLLAYRVLRELIHPDWALLITGALAVGREMVQRSGEVLSDLPFMLVVTASIWLYLRGLRRDKPNRNGWELASLLMVAGLWVRVSAVPIVAVTPLALLLAAGRGGRRRALLNAVLLVALTATTLLFFRAYHRAHAAPDTLDYANAVQSWAGDYTVFTWIGVTVRNLYLGAAKYSRLVIAQSLPVLVATCVLVAPALVGMARRVRRGDRFGPLLTGAYVGGIAAIGLETRYLYPLAPLLVLYLVEGWCWLARPVSTRRPAAARGVPLLLLAIVAGMNLPVSIRDVCLSRRSRHRTMQQKGKWADTIAAGEFLRARRKPGEALLSYQTVAYLADMPCPLLSCQVRFAEPAREQLVELLRQWRIRYVLYDSRDEPEPMMAAMHAYLSERSAPAFTAGSVTVYVVDSAGRPVSPATASAPTSAATRTRQGDSR